MTARKITLNLFLILFLFQTKAGCAAPPDNAVTLPNGLQIILRERHEKPLVGLDMWVRAGSREERAGEEGCAHFLEHTLFKGTQTRKTGETDFAIESLGGVFTATTGADYVHFGTVVPPPALEQALALLSDLMRNAALPKEEIDRERGPILDELAIHSGDATALAIDHAYALAYDKHPYRRSPGGAAAAIQAQTRDNLLAFYQRNYRPERAALVLVGDFDSAAAKVIIAKTFAGWKAADTKQNAPPISLAEPDLSNPRQEEINSAASDGRMVIGFRVPAASDKEATRALLLLDALLGGSDSGGLLDIPALTHTNAEARYTPRLDGSLFFLTAEVPQNADAERIENALLEIVQRLQTAAPAPSALRSARQQVLAQARFDGETVAGLARQLGYAALTQSDDPEDLARVLPLVKPQDVLKTAQTYLLWNRRIEVRVRPRTPEQSEGKPLDKN